MTSDRKKPTAGFWITVALVVVLAGYPLSAGPAHWLRFRGPFRASETARHVDQVIYRPLWFLRHQSEATSKALWWYECLFVPDSYLEQLILSDIYR